MKKAISIFFLVCVLLQSSVVEIQKFYGKQFVTEESETKAKEIEETSCKFLPSTYPYQFSAYLFYLVSKEKYAHFHQDPHAQPSLETFSPPPELS